MLRGVAQQGKRVDVDADRRYDKSIFVAQCRQMNVTPHAACNTQRNGGSAIDQHTSRHSGYALSQRRHKCIRQYFD